MIYEDGDEGDTRLATPSLRAHQYLHEDAIANWANFGEGHIVNIHYRAANVPPRFNNRNANRSGDHQDGEAPSVSLPGSSSSSSDVANTRRKGQDICGILLPPVSATVESAMARTLIAVKSLSQLNVPMSSYVLVPLARGSESVKRGAPDEENLDVPKFNKTSLGALERESMRGVEVRIGGDPKGHNCEELERGHSVERGILRLRPHRRLKVEVRIKIKIKIIQS